jgi:serine/threonine protein kinase
MQSSDQAISALSPEQRGHVDALLDELLDLPETERFASLRGRGIQDTAVAREVESLLRAASASNDFLSKTPRRRADDALQHAPAGTRLGVWRIVRLIGHGGMGDVYEATRAQGDFEHRVAIKLLRREAVAQLKRFEAERQILARLEHPCIARLYDGGITDDERPYMVMEYVEGLSITDYCAQKRASLQERLALFIQVCAAVTYAHQNLIVHRDLKASNILVTTTGTVKLLDFGIAKLLDAQSARMTHAAGAPLTPICAAPEQLTGAPVTTATDVYALGLLLFELLTGTHPWIGTDTPILLALRTALQRPAPVASGVAMVTANAPVLPRLIRGDLDAIVAKALRNEPAHRYATVDSLKLEIDRLLAGEPIEARKGARLYIVGRILRRYRWAATAIVVLIASALSVIAWQARQVSIEREAARRAGSREEAMRYNLTRLFRDGMAECAINLSWPVKWCSRRRTSMVRSKMPPAQPPCSKASSPNPIRRWTPRRWRMRARSWPTSSCCGASSITPLNYWIRRTHFGRAPRDPIWRNAWKVSWFEAACSARAASLSVPSRRSSRRSPAESNCPVVSTEKPQACIILSRSR